MLQSIFFAAVNRIEMNDLLQLTNSNLTNSNLKNRKFSQKQKLNR